MNMDVPSVFGVPASLGNPVGGGAISPILHAESDGTRKKLKQNGTLFGEKA